MQGTESGTIGALTINAISKSIRTNVDAISFRDFFGKRSNEASWGQLFLTPMLKRTI